MTDDFIVTRHYCPACSKPGLLKERTEDLYGCLECEWEGTLAEVVHDDSRIAGAAR